MLAQLLGSIVRQGTLTLISPDNRRRSFGTGVPEVTVKLRDQRAGLELALRPDLKLGELFMDGRLTVEEGDIALLLDLLMSNLAQHRGRSALLKLGDGWRKTMRRFAQYNPASQAKAHVAH